MIIAETMPKPVKRPKVRMVAVRKVTSEQNESGLTIKGSTCGQRDACTNRFESEVM